MFDNLFLEHRTIAVVIPYFQRESGILIKALNSVFSSEGVSDVRIIVVDDDSPVSAKSELANLGPTRFPVTVLEQANTGPGGARNTALDNLPAGTDYVAFLDSDDVWNSSHLKNAMIAMAAGYDVYFSDHVQLGAETSAFHRAGRIVIEQHPRIGGRDDLRAYEGDMFDQIITGNVIGTPTVAYNFHKFSKLRFRTDLTSAGEDYLFWLELTSKGASFSFGVFPEVTCGKGVNVYAGAGWGTEGHARRVLHELAYRQALVTLYTLNQRQFHIVVSAIKSLRDAFIVDCLHRCIHRKKIDWKLVVMALRQEPKIIARFPIVIFKKLFGTT
ncbi:glycosyltransferase family 2 protein [Dechloromonas denitrificans]|uniref:glycosyltransferase family 2 protein n=1 Tax=Dechloromonas denitrificans TaxID=281362 RepID=UPI001CF91F56|nr:glycosyltransferase family 2 protein [Dechloromonas denitrificans]UCV01936.1 glycosyltransferase family 2 protein [Dechloromonas denitrificans]UCV06270.1 glycosyltransferase family 2 protein [Dechloromonas denitrificans]